MNREQVKELAQKIPRERPECKVIGLLKFGDDDFALEVHDSELNEKYEVMNEKDWFIRRRKKEISAGKK